MSVDWSSLILILSPITVYEPPNWLQPENPCNLPVSKTAVISTRKSEALSSSKTTSQDVPSKESDTGPPMPWQPDSTNTANPSAVTGRSRRHLMVPSPPYFRRTLMTTQIWNMFLASRGWKFCLTTRLSGPGHGGAQN